MLTAVKLTENFGQQLGPNQRYKKFVAEVL